MTINVSKKPIMEWSNFPGLGGGTLRVYAGERTNSPTNQVSAMSRDEWLSRVQQGHVLFEITSGAQTLVRITERKSGRIWYANEAGPSNVRCVDARTGFSHDMSRHLIPQEAFEEDEYDRVWDMYGPPTITDGIT